MADLVSYFLCGQAFSECTLASTSQLVDMNSGQWCKELFDRLDLPLDKMPSIIQPGTVVGKVKPSIAAELGCGEIDVVAVGSHDTASAVAAVPAGRDENWAFLSSGTWSLMGMEINSAAINNKSYEYQFTNEGGVAGTVRLLKNIMGLWLVQECKRQWAKDGDDLSYDEITKMASDAEAFKAVLNPNVSRFLAPGNMPERINSYLAETGQEQIEDKGQMIRVILESLGFNYRLTAERLESMCGETIDVIHIVGGGIKNELLCQFASAATGRQVVAGPVEATASGNVLIQAMAAGQVDSLQSARKLVGNSFDLKTYQPSQPDKWADKYKKFEELVR